MFFKSFIASVLLILSIFAKNQAQNYNFVDYSSQQGLAQDQVRVVFQDSKGYLWFGTNGGGVSKFDGRIFTNYSVIDGLCNNIVWSVSEDSDANIWFGTEGGICKFNGHSFECYTKDDGLSNNIVRAILVDSKNRLWCGTNRGINCFDLSSEIFTTKTLISYSEKDGLANNHIRSIYEDGKKRIWFGTNGGGVSMMNEHKTGSIGEVSFTNYTEKEGLCNNIVHSMLEDKKGNMWFGTEGGISYFNHKDTYIDNKFSSFNTDEGLGSNIIYSIVQDSKGSIWCGTFGGLSKLEMNKNNQVEIINFTDNDGLCSNYVRSVTEDSEGNIWIGTYGAGVSRMVNLSYAIYKKINGLSDNFIWSVKEDSYGNIWVGTYTGGISVITNKKNSSSKHNIIRSEDIKGFNSECIYSIGEDSKMNVWLGTNEGLLKLKFKNDITVNNCLTFYDEIEITERFNTSNGLVANLVKAIYEDSKGRLWIGTTEGVSMIHNNKILNFTSENGLVNPYVYSFCEDNTGDIWISTDGGVSRYNGQGFENFTIANGLSSNDVRTVLADNSGLLWFGTGAGICVYNPHDKSFKYLDSKDGLSSNRLYFMLLGNDKETLWIGTVLGIDKFDMRAFHKNGTMNFKHVGHEEGLLEIETNTNAGCFDKDNNLWFGSINGLIKYDTEFIKDKNNQESKTYISRITVNKSDTFLVQNTILSHGSNTVGFNYTGISHTMPERVKFKYLLEGLETDWSPPVKETYVNYSNLAPGKYCFKVISCNNDGVWNKEPTAFSFEIAPAIWQTTWFKVLCAALLLVFIIAYIKLRERNLQRQKQILENKVRERTAEIQNKNEILLQQKEEISTQRDELTFLNEDLGQKNEEINAQKDQIVEQRDSLHAQKELLEHQKGEIEDSINYAKRIQDAVLPVNQYSDPAIAENFVLFRPKDIVSGDFHWAKRVGHWMIVAVGDCTGHGVPGAFMSMLGVSILNELVRKEGLTTPADILFHLRMAIIESLHQKNMTDDVEKLLDDIRNAEKDEAHTKLYKSSLMDDSIVKDGMDISLIAIDSRDLSCQFAGANRPIYVHCNRPLIVNSVEARILGNQEINPENDNSDNKGHLAEVKGDKMPVGIYLKMDKFTNHKFQLTETDKIYMFSDGYPDQFGGTKGRKLKSKTFQNNIINSAHLSLPEQGQILEQELGTWMGNFNQIDDITVVGISVQKLKN